MYIISLFRNAKGIPPLIVVAMTLTALTYFQNSVSLYFLLHHKYYVFSYFQRGSCISWLAAVLYDVLIPSAIWIGFLRGLLTLKLASSSLLMSQIHCYISKYALQKEDTRCWPSWHSQMQIVCWHSSIIEGGVGALKHSH